MMTAKYEYLFTVELLHRYFSGGRCLDVRIVPSARTAEVLRQHSIIFRQYDNRLYAGTPLDKDGKPFPAPANGTRFTFFLQLNNPLFFNYTNLPFTHPAGKVYYFTNRVANRKNSKNFLTQPISYSGSTAYQPGDLATNAAGTVFQATGPVTGIAPPADGVASSDWMPVDKNSYLTEADALQWLPFISTYRLDTQQISATISVSGFNPAAPEAYDAPLLSQTLHFPEPIDFFQLDLSTLPTGKYKLQVNGKTQGIYLNEELKRATAFAVLDIYQEATLPADYQLLNAGLLLSPLYTIHFLNRATIWKYILASGRAGSVTDNAAVPVYAFNGPPAATIYAASPIPLSEKALNLQLTINDHHFSPLPCATPQRLAKYNGTAGLYCSEIFLHY